MKNEIYPKVLVSMPSMGNPSFKTLQSMVKFASSKNFKCLFHFPEGSIIHSARNAAVHIALQSGCTHLMFIDDDMVFDPDAVAKLLYQDKDVIGALCFGRTDEMIKPIAKYIKDGQLMDYEWSEVEKWNETTKVDSTGTGFLLIKTEVLKALDFPIFYFSAPEEFGLKPLDPPRFDLSEDTTFMMKVKEKGFETWVDPTIIIGHDGGKVYQRPLVIPEGEIEIIIPTMGRFEKLQPLVDNIKETTTLPFHITFITDEQEVIDMFDGEKRDGSVSVAVSDKDTVSYAKRINRIFELTKSKYIFSGSNDIKFYKGWDIEAMKIMSIPHTGVVAVNDLLNPNGTNFLISREYIDNVGGTFDNEKGKVFHEYIHNFCDTELIIKAEREGYLRYADKSIVEHNHHLNKKAEMDDVYKKGLDSYETDKKEFEKRVSEYTGN